MGLNWNLTPNTLSALATLALAQPLPAADPPPPTRLQALKVIEDPEPVAQRAERLRSTI